MRVSLLAVIVGSLAMPAQAAPSGYELFLLACDGRTDCQRVADIVLGADGQKSEYATPGVDVRIEPLSALVDGTNIRMSMSLNPHQLGAAMRDTGRASGSQVSIQIDSAPLRHAYYSPIAVFSSANKIYQVWGRLSAVRAMAKGMVVR
jgi:hypothetical protein